MKTTIPCDRCGRECNITIDAAVAEANQLFPGWENGAIDIACDDCFAKAMARILFDEYRKENE